MGPFQLFCGKIRASARSRVRAARGTKPKIHLDCGRKRAAKAKWGLPRYMGWKNSIWISSSKTQLENKNYS